LIGGGNQLSSHIPRRNNGEEDCEEGDEEGCEEALSFDAPMTGVMSHPRFFCTQVRPARQARFPAASASA
jgi:hypothetical protein